MIVLIAVALTVSACGGKRKHRRECGKIQAYELARTAPSLYVPENLSRPDLETTHTIPALGADGQTGICMARAPQTLSPETMALVLEKDDVKSLVKQAKAEAKVRKKAQKAERKAAKQRRRRGEDSETEDADSSQASGEPAQDNE
ncbi:MAG: hypothetical protein V3T39_07415 [Gammaproteobacteria bacterium]